MTSTEWDLAECRKQYRELQRSHRELDRKSERNAQALIEARAHIERLRRRIKELEAERDAALGRKG